jgi:glyoxylase-like metal-dependent hydrolase (beta-lactamase superfamily II)
MDCEIEFLPVGDGSKPGDAIVVRYGQDSRYELMVIDGGNQEAGERVVAHIRQHYGALAHVSHVLLTHSDADHASGLRTVIAELSVGKLWLHAPWVVADAALPYFKNKNWTPAGLRGAIKAEYDIISELVDLATKRGIAASLPFAGTNIGPFHVLSPSPHNYTLLVPQFDKTPDPDQEARFRRESG